MFRSSDRDLPNDDKTQLAVLGALPDVVQDQMLRLLTDMVEDVLVLPQQPRVCLRVKASFALSHSWARLMMKWCVVVQMQFTPVPTLAQMEQLNGWRRLQNVLVLSRVNLTGNSGQRRGQNARLLRFQKRNGPQYILFP